MPHHGHGMCLGPRVRTGLHKPLNLGITTRWAGARDPLAENAAFNITLSEAELRKLIAALQNGLSDNA